MSSFELGAPVPLTLAVTVAGVPTDATTVALTLLDPTGAQTTPPVSHTGVGAYACTVTPPMVGAWAYHWVTTGPGGGSLSGGFTITPAFSVGIVSLTDAKAQLNLRPGYTTDDVELQGFIDAATAIVEDIAGIVLPRTIIGETYDGGGPIIALRQVPVISISSVTETVFGTTYPLSPVPAGTVADGYQLVDPVRGIVARRGFGLGTFLGYGSGGGYGYTEAAPYSPDNQMLFLAGKRGVTVSYIAGYASVPANVRLGALLLIQHLWSRTQQGGRPAFVGSGSADDAPTPVDAGYTVPGDVRELLLATPTSPQRVTGIW